MQTPGALRPRPPFFPLRQTRVPTSQLQTQGQMQAQAPPPAQVALAKPPVVSVPAAVVSSPGVTTLPMNVAGISVAIGQPQKAAGACSHPLGLPSLLEWEEPRWAPIGRPPRVPQRTPAGPPAAPSVRVLTLSLTPDTRCLPSFCFHGFWLRHRPSCWNLRRPTVRQAGALTSSPRGVTWTGSSPHSSHPV